MPIKDSEVFQMLQKIIMKEIDINKVTEIKKEMILGELGINSISFLKIVVAIETELDFEFDDDDLVTNNFTTIESLATYIKYKINI